MAEVADAEKTGEEEVVKITPPESGAPFNEVEDVIYRRRSVRYFKKKQVPEYLIRRILEAGRFAPSAGNAQTWKFIVVRDQKMLDDMAETVVDVTKKAKKFADYIEPGQEKKLGRAKFIMKRMPNMFHPIPFGAMKYMAEGKLGVWDNAPTVILILADKHTPGDPSIDVGITGQNMVLAAHSYGLGTCWVSFAKPLGMDRKWKKVFGIRYPYKLYTSLAIGYPQGNPDGYVPRETAAVDWFDEDGNFKVVY